MNKPHKDDVHLDYALALLHLLGQKGITRDQALAGTGLRPEQLDDTAWLTTRQDTLLFANAARLSRNPAIGFQAGLCSTLTQHGMLGYGLMCCATLRDALGFWIEFLDLRLATFCLRMDHRDGFAELHVSDLAPQAPARRHAIDRLLAMTAQLCGQLAQQPLPGMAIWHRDDPPFGHARYETPAMTVRFGTGACLMRIPAGYLDLPLASANATMLRDIRIHCERERARLKRSDDLMTRIEDLLQRHGGSGYPSLEQTAAMLHMSSRTLKRKLQLLGSSYRSLTDDARKNIVLRDIRNPLLRMEEIALRVGYTDCANLTRAFRRWTGETPTHYRARLLATGA